MAADTCLGGAPGESQKLSSVSSAAGKSLQILGLDVGQQHHAFEIVRKSGELLADLDDRLERLVELSFGQGDGIIRFGFRGFVPPSNTLANGLARAFVILLPPNNCQAPAENQYQKKRVDGVQSPHPETGNGIPRISPTG